MKRSPLLPLTLAIIASGLVSCSSVQTAMTKAAATGRTAMTKVANTSKKAVAKVTTPVKSSFAKIDTSGFTLPRFGRKPTPPIVEVAKADSQKKAIAKKSKSSKADAIAWKRKKAASKRKWSPKKDKALVPKDFEASDLDVDGQIPSYGILPSLSPGGRTSISEMEETAVLPADVANLPQIPSMRTRNRFPDLSSVPDYLKPAGPVPAIKTGN